jgi:signal transduction histidine kinase
MVINSLNAINRSIKKNIILSLVSLLVLSLLIVNVIYFKNINAVNQQNKIEITSNFDLLKSHISEKISIIGSSSAFIDYLRSGSVSQRSLKSDFIFDIRSLKLKEISGMKIVSTSGDKIFSDGAVSPYFVNLPLCYFDRELDSKLGDCSHNLILYLDVNEITKSLQKINDNLLPCKNCTSTDFLSNKKFGSFNVTNASSMPLSFQIKSSQNFNIITVNLIVLLFMAILAIWTWRKTNSILDKYISDPLKIITNKLKSGEELAKNNEIEELAYLVNQIQDREEKLKLAKENENLINIGQMVTQVAHDMKSPLAVINSIIKQADQFPEQQRTMMGSANQQLNDLADNLLSHRIEIQNKLNKKDSNALSIPHTTSVLLDSIIAEKRAEYNHLPITIYYNVNESANTAATDIAAVDFKRVISNILNNAIEAILGSGDITVTLAASSEMATIMITDSGMGMKLALIRKILNGESVSCKKDGAGIGLASSYKFIKSWGGDLDIASQPKVGTTVSITIPILAHEAVVINQILKRPDLILIDDNKSVTDSWKLSALHKKKDIVVFNNINDVSNEIKDFDRATPIYIDYDLGETISGEQYAKNLYDQGFINIYLTTGYQPSSFKPMHWIKSVIGKEPSFEQ